MKKLSVLFGIAVLSAASASGQLGYSLGYAYSNPGTAMRTTIQGAHSFSMEGFSQVRQSGLSLGLEMSLGSYGRQESDQYYAFDNGTSMLAPVTVANNLFMGSIVARYELLKDASITPFVTGRIGAARMGTRLTIEDPRSIHTDECPVPLENDLLSSDWSFTTGAGIGLRFDLGSVFAALGRGNYMVDLSADYLWGSSLEYMSVNAPSANANFGENVGSVNLPFANRAQPEVVHQYHTGYAYRTPLEFTSYRIAFVYRF